MHGVPLWCAACGAVCGVRSRPGLLAFFLEAPPSRNFPSRPPSLLLSFPPSACPSLSFLPALLVRFIHSSISLSVPPPLPPSLCHSRSVCVSACLSACLPAYLPVSHTHTHTHTRAHTHTRRVGTWMDSIELRLPGACLVLVATHIDCAEQDEVERQVLLHTPSPFHSLTQADTPTQLLAAACGAAQAGAGDADDGGVVVCLLSSSLCISLPLPLPLPLSLSVAYVGLCVRAGVRARVISAN